MVEGARLERVFSALNPAELACETHPPPLPPPPLASTDGSLTENLNKTGVRLWTDRSRPSTAETD